MTQMVSAKTLILLHGPMGAGKTEFVKNFVGAFGVTEAASPTFALHHAYRGRRLIDHWDLYRLQDQEDLESSGFWDQFERPEFLVIVEWAERLPKDWIPRYIQILEIKIEVLPQGERQVQIVNRV